jgi:hypothetical protein
VKPDLGIELRVAIVFSVQGIPPRHADLLLRGLEDQIHGFSKPLPVGCFRGKLLAALGGQLVEPGLPAVFGFAPFCVQPTPLLQPVQREGTPDPLNDFKTSSAKHNVQDLSPDWGLI